MIVLTLLALGAAVLVVFGGGLGLGYLRRGRSHDRWKHALDEAASRLPGARVSPGSRFDGPELRVEQDGHTVSVFVRGADDASRGVALAKARLDPAPASRLWFGWDDIEAPSDWSHIDEVGVNTTRIGQRIVVRSDDVAFAQRFVDGAHLDLVDVRREARAHGVSAALRGGYLELRFEGIVVSSHLLERLVIATARLASSAPEWAAGTRLTAPDSDR